MTPKLRLIVTSCLFVGWIGYLAYLVSITRNPVILSRPQFLEADLYVIVKVDSEAGTEGRDFVKSKVKVREVAWCRDAADNKLVGTDLSVEHLNSCGKKQGFIGKGDYILPLTKVGGDYVLTDIPLSPGFHRNSEELNFRRIYPDTPQSREQLKLLIADFHSK